MFLKRYIILQLCAFCAHMAFSQSPTDTLPKKIAAKELPGVEVWSYSSTPAYSRVTNLSDAVSRNKSNNLADVLQENSGIYLKNYGPGMLSSMAFRGTGAEHTALVWNGININYPSLGQADFATVPVNGFSNVALIHGSSSNIYGSSAIGGSVILGNYPTFTSGSGFDKRAIKTSATFEAGSYNRWFGAVSNFVGTKKFSSRTSAQWLTSDNDFKFINSAKIGKPIERQVNSAITQRAFLQDFDFVTGDKSFLSIKGWYNFTDRHIPPSITSADNKAHQRDESIRLLAEWRLLNNNNNTTIREAYIHDFIGYNDISILSNANTSTSTLQINHVYHFAKQFDISGGIEGQYFTANIKEYQTNKAEWRGSAFATLRYFSRNDRLICSAGYRQILIQHGATAAAPTMGLSYACIKNANGSLNIKASVSRSYRVPTLNERYWVPYGNPAIKPEGGWNYELGVKFDRRKGAFTFLAEATGFAMHINNWIQWQPVNGIYSEPKNIKQVFSRGTEVSTNISYTNNKLEVRLSAAYTLAIATNQKTYNANTAIDGRDLIYTPRHVASGGLTLSYYGFVLFTNIQYTGRRYTTTDNSQYIQGYTLANMRLSKDVKMKNFTLSIWLQMLNTTNASYFNLPYRSMPLRNYRAGMTITFEKQLKNISHEK